MSIVINTNIDKIKSKKNFYIKAYRKELKVLIFLLGMQVLWIMMIMFVVIDRQGVIPRFFASSSVGILTPLKPLPVPNTSDKPLLE
jgi:hypothetical protein